MLTSTAPALFTAQLIGMPEAFADRRRALAEQFRDAMVTAYGSEAAASGALHTYLDSGDLEAGDVPWEVAQASVVSSMRLPPGACFRCSIVGLRG